MSWLRRLSSHALVSLAVLFASALVVEPLAAQNLHYGMNTRVLTPRMADKMAELGSGVVRLAYGWDIIEPNCKGCFNWTITDAWRDEAKRTGRTIFASLAYAPGWANGGHPFNYPPLDVNDWYDFVFATVSRYRDDIVLWGVWNEPNLDIYLHGADLDTYQRLTQTAFMAIRAANPRAQILGPEISWHATQSGWYSAAMRRVGALFDIVTVHWYADAPRLDRFMDDLVRPQALGKNVWLSETGMKPCGSSYGEVGQALFYRQVLEAFQARRAWWTHVSFYDLYDEPGTVDCGSAITRGDWSNRPAFTLMQKEIAERP